MEREHTATVEFLTLEEFRHLPEEDQFLLDLVRGRVVREPRPGALHGWIFGRLYYALETWARETEAGMVVAEAGFVLEREPPTVRGPDVAYIDADRLPGGGVPAGFWDLAPDLAVEILSPSNRPSAILEQTAQYLESGVRRVWIADPARRTVTVYRADGAVSLLGVGDTLEGEDVLPGFRLEVEEIFE